MRVDMKFDVAIVPVSDVDRAKSLVVPDLRGYGC
jgi:hypothetical protein